MSTETSHLVTCDQCPNPPVVVIGTNWLCANCKDAFVLKFNEEQGLKQQAAQKESYEKSLQLLK